MTAIDGLEAAVRSLNINGRRTTTPAARPKSEQDIKPVLTAVSLSTVTSNTSTSAANSSSISSTQSHGPSAGLTQRNLRTVPDGRAANGKISAPPSLASVLSSAKVDSHTSVCSTSTPLTLTGASLIRSDFLHDRGLFSISTDSSAASDVQLSLRERKLLVWQALLIGFRICKPEGDEDTEYLSSRSDSDGDQSTVAYSDSEVSTVRGATGLLKRPSHFPPTLLDLPTTLNGCRTLLKQYAFVNILDYILHETGELDDEEFRIFESLNALFRYTRKNKRYVRLGRAKEDMLNPLLRTMWRKSM
ncbi:hypothetical protein EMMF5_004804 [Cystobasidiomycetes sp. EMM_F5]